MFGQFSTRVHTVVRELQLPNWSRVQFMCCEEALKMVIKVQLTTPLGGVEIERITRRRVQGGGCGEARRATLDEKNSE